MRIHPLDASHCSLHAHDARRIERRQSMMRPPYSRAHQDAVCQQHELCLRLERHSGGNATTQSMHIHVLRNLARNPGKWMPEMIADPARDWRAVYLPNPLMNRISTPANFLATTLLQCQHSKHLTEEKSSSKERVDNA